MSLTGQTFYKMSGSGNDFVFFDCRGAAASDPVRSSAAVRAVCHRRLGIGADGVVVVEDAVDAAFAIHYINSDGTPAALCGNATLCSIRLAVELGIEVRDGIRIRTESGLLSARLKGSLPEFDLGAVGEVRAVLDAEPVAGERRIGFGLAGVPHVVVLCDDVESARVDVRGRELRGWPSLPHGANVNFVSRRAGGAWAIRTYERGVEAETLACGTGAVVTSWLLRMWGVAGDESRLVTRSGRALGVRFRENSAGDWVGSLQGEGRLVYRGVISKLASQTDDL